MQLLNISAVFKMRNGEFLQFMKNVISIYSRMDINGLKLDKRVMDLQSAINDLEKVFQISTTHELTSHLNAADKKRLKVMKALKKVLESILLREDETSTSATKLIENYIFHAKNLGRLSLPQKTACIDALINDWSVKPHLLEAKNTLQLSDWITLLQKSNEECNNIYIKRVETTKKSGKITEKKATIKTFFDELIRDTEAYHRLVEDNESYKSLLQNLNTMTGTFSMVVNSRYSDKRKGNIGENAMDAVSESE